MKRLSRRVMQSLAVCGLAMALAVPGMALAHKDTSKGATKGKKPWTPRKDCTGVYGTKSKAKATKVTLSALMASPKKYEGKLLHVAGKVKAACKFKGCWMMLSEGKHKMRIRFKGYGFFVPTNSAGYQAVAVGKAKVRVMSVKMQRHYLMDAGKPELAKKITKPKTTVAFTANWVALHKGKKPAKAAK